MIIKSEKEKKEKTEVYVVAEHKKMIVQNFVRELKGNEIDVKCIGTDFTEVNFLPNLAIHIVVCLSEELDVNVYRVLKNKALKNGAHIYFLGNQNVLSIEEEEIFKATPAFSFSGWPVDINLLLQAIVWNERTKKRILVVDDDPMLLRNIKNWLANDYEVYMVNSGFMALDFVIKHPIDLILLDYEMPGMDGPEVLKRLRLQNQFETMPVIFLTAKDDRESVLKAMEHKANGYILKSRPPQEIIAVIKDFFKKYIIDIEKLQ